MSNPIFHEFTKQASFFLKEKIKTARLAITDVTAEEILTEEVTRDNHLPPDARTMAVISRAAFEVGQFGRIVKILHNRLLRFDRKNWRSIYNALILLQHLLIHGPISVAKEFEFDKQVIEEARKFRYIDEKGNNWGKKVGNLAERVQKLLEDGSYLREEREQDRKKTCGRIKGFGAVSFPSFQVSKSEDSYRDYSRCTSLFNYQTYRNDCPSGFDRESERDEKDEDHPFIKEENKAKESLLPTAT